VDGAALGTEKGIGMSQFLLRRRGRRRQFVSLGVVIVGALALAGCAEQFSGGGGMASALGGPNANFGFNYKLNSSDPLGGGSLQGVYIDRDASGTPVVKMKFTGSPADICGAEFGTSCDTFINNECGSDASCQAEFHSADNCIFSEASYTSTNPARPGSGIAVILSCDRGKGGTPSTNNDSLGIQVFSGPYNGYFNEGTITNGNLTAK
jgi:hypothetical protein